MRSHPKLDRLQLVPDTNVEELVETHRTRVALISAERGIPAVCMSTLQEVLASQQRIHQLNAEHRRSVGYVTREEFEEIAGKKLRSGQRAYITEFERLRDLETDAADDAHTP